MLVSCLWYLVHKIFEIAKLILKQEKIRSKRLQEYFLGHKNLIKIILIKLLNMYPCSNLCPKTINYPPRH